MFYQRQLSNYNLAIHNVDNNEVSMHLWYECIAKRGSLEIASCILNYIGNNYDILGHEINQKFLSTGHSFLPCDRDFALIEKQKKTAKVLVPSQWKYVIANARLEKPFRIIEMSQNDFKDFSALEQDIAKKNLKITQAMWLKLTADAPKHVNIRESHNTLKPWTSHQIRQNNFKDNTLSPAYESPVALTKEKKKDLLDLCKYMPQQYSDFYTSLPG
ncbi:hypothetical protein QTP88_001148 [Uroleucon formosanum]